MQISFFQINSLDEAIQKLRFFRDILSPIIESYWFVASSLLCLCDGQHIGKIFEYFRQSRAELGIGNILLEYIRLTFPTFIR